MLLTAVFAGVAFVTFIPAVVAAIAVLLTAVVAGVALVTFLVARVILL